VPEKPELPIRRFEYSKKEREEILSVLEKYCIEDAVGLTRHTERIVFAMSRWVFEDEVSTAKLRRRHFESLFKQVRNLEVTLRKLSFPEMEALALGLALEIEKHDSIDDELLVSEVLGTFIEGVSLLKASTENALLEKNTAIEKSGGAGRPRRAGALVALIRMLEMEWTKRGFKSGFNATKEDRKLSGPFCSFVEAAVKPVLHKKNLKDSLSHRIREALKEDYERSGSFIVEGIGQRYSILARRFHDLEEPS